MSNLISNPIVILVAVLVVAIVIAFIGIFLYRSGKKKSTDAGTNSPNADWQQQAQNAPGNWNQPAAPDSPWGQQQQQAGTWGAQNPAQQQAANPWAAQNAAQPQPPAANWAPSSQDQPANPWAAQNAAQPQPANPWAAQNAAQPQPQAANPWATQNAAQPQPQPQANPWATQNAGQQPSGGAWANPNAQPAGAGIGSQNPWENPQATAQPDPWAQQSPQAVPQGQGNPPAWNAPTGQPGQVPNSFNSAGQNNWGQPTGQPADPWAQAQNPGAGQQQPWGQSFQPPNQGGALGQIPSTPSGNSPSLPSWQQPGGPQQDLGGTPFSPDSDKTMLRSNPGPSAGLVGTVRVEEGKEPGRVYEVRKESLSIGRSRESDIFLEDLAVSRLHASIVNMGNGNYGLKDEGSANGTKVNGQLVNKYQTYPLNEGDKVQLGQTVLVFAKR